MSKVLYIDACGGLSGDMLAGALLDLGWPLEDLRGLVARLEIGPVRLDETRVEHQGLAARRLVVEEGHGHPHGQGHVHGHHHGHQPHRRLSDILGLLARLPEAVGAPAARVFTRLAEAEARVHGKSVEEVHFHEVGAVDAIVDVTAFCAGVAWLGVESLVCSALPLGRGFVQCAHGRLPLPAPAVLSLLAGAPVWEWPAAEETVTPTGAALVSTLAKFAPMPAMRLMATGLGGGSRVSAHAPNVVRLLLGEAAGGGALADEVSELTCHLDDMNPEDLPMVFERLMAAGALDVAAAPLIMKKGRPGLALTVLCPPALAEDMAALVLVQTTTLGLRLARLGRRILPREIFSLDSPWGPVRVKRARVGDGWRYHPEAEDVARICRETGLAPQEVRRELTRLAER